MRDFRKLRIWEDSIEFAFEIYRITEKFPSIEKFGLISQMTRASVSIASNIAEGCRGSDKELKQFLNIALGSAFEVETQIIISHKIGIIDSNEFQEILGKINLLQKQINAFRTSLKAS